MLRPRPTWTVEDEQILDHLVGGRVEVLPQGRPRQNAVARPKAKVELPEERVHFLAAQTSTTLKRAATNKTKNVKRHSHGCTHLFVF